MRSLPLLAAALAAAFALTPAAEAAQGRKKALATGALLGAAGIAGAAILLGNQRPARAAPMVEEEEIIERPAPRYVPTCRMVRKKVFLDDETYTYRRVEVCQ